MVNWCITKIDYPFETHAQPTSTTLQYGEDSDKAWNDYLTIRRGFTEVFPRDSFIYLSVFEEKSGKVLSEYDENTLSQCGLLKDETWALFCKR